MAKQSGLGDNLYVAGFDVSGDIGSLGRISTPRPLLEVTGIDKSAVERIPGLRDGGMEFSSFFNDATGQAHEAFNDLLTTDQHVMYCRGTTIGNPGAGLVAKQLNYDLTRGQDGSLVAAIAAEANAFGLDWGRLLTAGKRTDTTATNGAGVDHTTVTTTFGWTAYLQVFSLTGTSVTVTLQDSADNVSFANITGGAFAAATGRTSERLAGAGGSTVRRYIRAITSGTFTNAVFAVLFVRNEATVVV